ncbi:MAG: sigma-70 family RNA polymerase sigma factor [Acidobacteriota bacterium]
MTLATAPLPPFRSAAERLADLVTRTSAGDRDAEAELVAELSRGTLLFIRRLTQDVELAEDLCQETFRIVLMSLREGRLKNPKRLAAFVQGTAKNLLRSEWRKRDRRGLHSDVSGLSLQDESPDPWDRARQAEDRAHVRQILDEMPSERDRQVLYRHYLEDQEKSEICSRLGIAAEQFNLILFRARQRFRHLVESEHHGLRLVHSS